VVLLAHLVLRRTKEAFPLSWAAVLTWGGLRGGLSMVLVLGLPALAHRDLLVTMTFGVVIVSILAQGLTMGPLLRRLGLVGHRSGALELERLRGAARGASAALDELDRARAEGSVSAASHLAVRSQFEQRLAGVKLAIDALHLDDAAAGEEEKRRALSRALTAEKDAVLSARAAGTLSGEAAEDLLADVDARLVAATTQEH